MNAHRMRPKTQDDMVTIRLNLNTKAKAQLETLARQRGLKMSAMARALLEQAMTLEHEETDLALLLRRLQGGT